MPPEARDKALLFDMLRSARDAVSFLGDRSFDEFCGDAVLVAAIERKVEIVGEAARSVSESFKERHRDVAWRKIIASRHIIAHDYGDVDREILYRIVRDHLPVLIRRLDQLVGGED